MYAQTSNRSERIAPASDFGLPDDFGAQAEGLDIKTVFRTILLGKWWILAFMLAAMALGVWFVKNETPLYQSEALVVLRPEERQMTIGLENVMSGMSVDEATINTEKAVLTSRALLDRVVETMDLESDPEFNPELRDPGLVTRIRRAIGDLFRTGEREPLDDFERRQAAIATLSNTLAVGTIRESYVFTIGVLTTDPTKSADIANTLTRLYIESQLQQKFDSQREATDWLTDRVAELKSELETAEAQVEAYSSDASFVSEEAVLVESRALKDLRRRRQERTERRLQLVDLMQQARTLREAQDFSGIAQVLSDARLEGMARQVAASSGTEQRDERVAAFDRAFDRRVSQMLRESEQTEVQAGVLESSIAEQAERVDVNSAQLVELRQLQREAEASRLIYEYFLTRLKETAIQQGIQKADSQIMSPAVRATDAAYPRMLRMTGLFGVMGLLLGTAIVFLRDYMKSTYRGPEEIEARTGLPVIGTIPRGPRKAPLDYVAERPASALAEAVRNLRTSLLMTNADRPPQIVMVTSSQPGEGKSSTALMLGQVSAALGKRVLVIECDSRRPTFARQFGIASGPGLFAALKGEVAFEEVINSHPKFGFDVIHAQKSTDNAADLFASRRFAEFLAEAREQYDLVFLDTPPVLAVPDARIIAKMADALLYVVRWDWTEREQVASGIHLFSQLGVRITGVALTQTNPKKMARYGFHGYGYGGGGSEKYYAD